jgi:hypothetical protein
MKYFYKEPVTCMIIPILQKIDSFCSMSIYLATNGNIFHRKFEASYRRGFAKSAHVNILGASPERISQLTRIDRE